MNKSNENEKEIKKHMLKYVRRKYVSLCPYNKAKINLL